ncbi:hypothetical protein [Dyella humicola]|nr:hypothetical protein [Dyella humicola]
MNADHVLLACCAYFMGMVTGNFVGMWMVDWLRAGRLRNKRRMRGIA